MSTLAELRTHRDEAGAAYVAAFEALRSAWITLRAHEIALASQKVASPVPSFGGAASNPDLATFKHPTYLTNAGGNNWYDQAVVSSQALVAAFPTPDE